MWREGGGGGPRLIIHTPCAALNDQEIAVYFLRNREEERKLNNNALEPLKVLASPSGEDESHIIQQFEMDG